MAAEGGREYRAASRAAAAVVVGMHAIVVVVVIVGSCSRSRGEAASRESATYGAAAAFGAPGE